jgi:hypothetical protein
MEEVKKKDGASAYGVGTSGASYNTPDAAYVSKLESMFDQLDLNKDGKIDPRELIVGLRKMGYSHITEEQIKVGHCVITLFARRVVDDLALLLTTLYYTAGLPDWTSSCAVVYCRILDTNTKASN